MNDALPAYLAELDEPPRAPANASLSHRLVLACIDAFTYGLLAVLIVALITPR